jgi:ferric-dicitrate binding protein FerR (iron transport regulator)
MKTDIPDKILKFFSKSLKEKEMEELNDNLSTSHENRKLFDEYNETHQLSQMHHFYQNIDKRWNELSLELGLNNTLPKRDKKVRRLIFKALQYAAVLVFLVSVTGITYLMLNKPDGAIVSVMTQGGQKSEINLSDGSKVWLNSRSKLLNTNGFSTKNRELTLQGEAYFDVETNKNSPFKINIGNANVSVFGTKFNISSYAEDEKMIVSLEEGSVGFTIFGAKKPIMLNPGQQLIYNKNTNEVSVQDVQIDLYTSWKDNRLRFSDATLPNVFKKMERWYDVIIILDPELVISERLTLTIKTESLSEMMEILKKVSDIEYTIENDIVHVSKKGGGITK